MGMTEAGDTPGARLARLIDEREDLTKTELARMLGYTGGYQVVYKWCLDRGFNAPNQRRVEDALGLPRGYFSAAPGELPRAMRPAGRIPSRAAILADDPANPEWAAFVERGGAFIERLPDWALYAVKLGPALAGHATVGAYLELAMAYVRLHDGESLAQVLLPLEED
jgi:hypothetical protein